MIRIGKTLVSLDIIQRSFCCNLKKCKGTCCVLGDAGAPLEKEEIEILKKDLNNIKNYLRPEGIISISKHGVSVIDNDKEDVTPLVDGKECAFVVFEKGIAKCGIEIAYQNKKTSLKKPISCHLYPIRLSKYDKFIAVNYDKWEICNPARELGINSEVKIYSFVKDALIRKFGLEWYEQLKIAAREIVNKRTDSI